MSKVKIGGKIPSFSTILDDGTKLNSKDFDGKNIVIYFYPKDSTPGCTKEGEDFRDLHKEFIKSNAQIYGVSRDSIASHQKFKTKYKFPFHLISDEDESLCKIFGVIKEKNMYGRKYMGIERSTFLINDKGRLLSEWRKVKVKGHAQEVLDTLKKN